MRRKKNISVKLRGLSRGLVSRIPGELDNLMPAKGGVAVVPPAATTVASNVRYENGVTCSAPGYESINLTGTLDGPPTLIFQANTVNVSNATPIVLGTKNLWVLLPSYDGVMEQFGGTVTSIFTGAVQTPGYYWTAENFYDKVICAQRNNNVQYWQTDTAASHDLPGLPVSDASWDGVTSFFGHILLWKDDRLKWSDVDDFSTFLPVASTAVSAVLTLGSPYTQPAPGGQVTVAAAQTVAAVSSISLAGDLTFPNTLVGGTATAVLNIVNTGTASVTLASGAVTFSSGVFTASFAGATLAPGASQAVTVTFTPVAGTAYIGTVSVAVPAGTIGTFKHPIQGTGLTPAPVIELSGVLDFGNCGTSHTLVSSLIVKNTGNAPMTITGITLPTGFTSSYPGGSVVIAAKSRAVYAVTFAPVSAITYSGNITVAVSGSFSGTNTLAISGAGVTTLSTATAFVTDNGTCQFGSVTIGTSQSGTVTITNPSTGAITLNSLTLPAGWTAALSLPATIASLASLSVAVTFAPTAVGQPSGLIAPVFSAAVVGNTSFTLYGVGVENTAVCGLSGNLAFGSVPVGGSLSAQLTIINSGTLPLTVSSVTCPEGFVCSFAGTVAAGASVTALVTFSPTTDSTYGGDLVVDTPSTSLGTSIAVSGVGLAAPQPAVLVADQAVVLTFTVAGVVTYNYYTVVSATATTLVLKRQDLTGGAATGTSITSGQFFTLDANEAGETQVVGAQVNGPIFQVIPQGDYAFVFKERSIQSIQYVGQGSGTFLVRNEVFGEGLLGRNAVINRNDGVLVFLGHKELYTYSGGPTPTPVCIQTTQQLYAELDRSRLPDIRLLHNEKRHEIWVKYPVLGGFRVMIWNYLEDSATFDDYDASVEFTSFSLANWSIAISWNLVPSSQTWSSFSNASWSSLASNIVDRLPVLACADGALRIHGRQYARDGAGYLSVSETMDFNFGDSDLWKYVDTVVLGLDVVMSAGATPARMTVQVGARAALNVPASQIVWTDPAVILVDGTQLAPVNVNPGGSGRFLRLRFSSSDPGVQWRVSSFEIYCRPGNTY